MWAWLLLVLAGFPIIFVHQVAHGLVAVRCTGGRAEVQVGRGPRLGAAPLGSLDLALNLLPAGGHCHWQPTPRTTPREQALVALAGPAATLGCFALLGAIAWSEGPGHPLLGAAASSAGVAFLASALPVRYGRLVPHAPESDGLVAWRCLAAERGRRGESVPREHERDTQPLGWDTSDSHGPPRA
jgi:hypothetical protein